MDLTESAPLMLRAGDLTPVWYEGVALWLIRLDHRRARSQESCLSDEERRRAASFRFEKDRQRYLAAHVALRERLAVFVGCPPEQLAFEAGEQGKPRLAKGSSSATGVHFNLSHSEDLALVALSEEEEVGVDLEVIRAVEDAPALAALVFGVNERRVLRGLTGTERDCAFLQGWTRKEACLKALGTGLSLSPLGFEAGLHDMVAEVVIDTPRYRERLALRSLAVGGPADTETPWVGAVARRLGRA